MYLNISRLVLSFPPITGPEMCFIRFLLTTDFVALNILNIYLHLLIIQVGDLGVITPNSLLQSKGQLWKSFHFVLPHRLHVTWLSSKTKVF